MLENNQKGWHGCFSRIGKNSAEQFTEIIKKDEIFNRLYKTVKVKDIFSPDKKKTNLELIEDSLKVFQIYQRNLNEKLKINKKNEKKKDKKKKELFIKNILKNSKFKYHNIHILNDKKKKLKVTPSIPLIEYNPNYNYIYNRSLSGPEWKNIRGRIYPKTIIDKRDFFSEKNNLINKSGEFKCLVNMDKTTKRGEFIDLKDVRIRNDKAFIQEKKHKNKKKKPNLKLKDLLNYDKKEIRINDNLRTLLVNKNEDISYYQDINSPLFNKDDINNNFLLNNRISSSFNIRKNEKINKEKESFKSKTLNRNNEIESKIIKPSFSEKKLKGHDFKKDTSREYLEKLRDSKSSKFLISYLTPNYSLVTENIGSNVKYISDKKKYNKYKKNLFIGIEPNPLFDPDKIIDKYNNHKSIKVPDFKLMSSRYSKKNKKILPCYMQRIFQRGIEENINEKTLELNDYSNGYLRSSKSTFFPKKSFNNIINLNLINATYFKNKIKSDEIKEKINMIKNEISFNHKGYEELIKEGALKRFDGVTYKSNKIKSNININDLLYKSHN